MIKKIIENIFYKHIGLVFKLDANSIKKKQIQNFAFKHEICYDCNEILSFYRKVGYSHLNTFIVDQYLKNNVLFFCIKDNGMIIAINAIYFKEVRSKGLSFYSLLEKKCQKIILNSNTAYSGMVVVEPKYRGNKLYSSLFSYIADFLSNSNVNDIILTTGANNTSMIKATLELNAKLISIVEICRILRYFIIRNELYKNIPEINWISV